MKGMKEGRKEGRSNNGKSKLGSTKRRIKEE